MKKATIIVVVILSCLCVHLIWNSFAEEKVTLTTYYPAPYGIYKELRSDQATIGSAYRNATLSDGELIIKEKVGIGTPTPQAALDVVSTTSGFLPPRMTIVQRDAIVPVIGETIYNTDTKKMESYNGTVWKTSGSDWPEGHYCIMRAGGSCPAGFNDGRICVDSEDDANDDTNEGDRGDSGRGNNPNCGGPTGEGFRFCCK